MPDSGVIAVVVAGMICGNYGARTGMTPSTRVAVETFWEYVAFALNSIVFLLIGLEVHLAALFGSWRVILVAYLVVTASRGLVIFAVSGLLQKTREKIPWPWSVARMNMKSGSKKSKAGWAHWNSIARRLQSRNRNGYAGTCC